MGVQDGERKLRGFICVQESSALTHGAEMWQMLAIPGHRKHSSHWNHVLIAVMEVESTDSNGFVRIHPQNPDKGATW